MADPAPAEQLVLEMINRARADPSAEGTRLATFSPVPLPGGDIREGLSNPSNVGVRPPLAMSAMLHATALAHSDDMYNRDYFAHDTLSPPTQTWDQRINAGGYVGSIGENIATSSSGTAAFLEDFLMVDWYLGAGGTPTPVPNRGHRVNLLDVDSGSAPYREIGVGYHLGASARPSGFKDFLTEDFGRRSGVGPFLVGVVFDDTSSSTYTTTNGCAGVTISLKSGGSYYAVSASAGGYSFPVGTSGTVIVLATGGIFTTNTVAKAVNLKGENVKVDFKKSDLSIVDTDLDGLPDSWEIAHFGDLTKGPADDPDGDGFNNVDEFNPGTDPMNAGSVPVVPGPPGVTPSSGGGGGGGGGCGLTGLEAVLLLALLRFRRR